MSDELNPLQLGGIGAAVVAAGAWLLNWRKAGYTELSEVCDRQAKALDKQDGLLASLQSQITQLNERINSGHAAIINAEDRAAASEIRAANAEAARLLIEERYREEVADLRAEVADLRQQIIDAGLTPRVRRR